MHVFYAPSASQGLFCLPQDESYHCIKVLRFRQGDLIIVTNGSGLLLEGTLMDEDITGVQISAKSVLKNHSRPIFNLHIAISPLKNVSRFEWFVEKAAEMRVSQITPLICNRTEKRNIRIDRMQKIALEAMKQSKSEYLTKINEPVSMKNFLKNKFQGYSTYIAICSDSQKTQINELESRDVVVLIGPEGDFTGVELNEAITAGCIPLGLGHSRLRTETAGVFTAAYMYSKYLQR